jgi:hypothetical protein
MAQNEGAVSLTVGSKNSSWSVYTLAFLVVLACVYIALRAATISLTHDEAFTFFSYVKQPWEFTLEVKYTNNHLLNSILTKVSTGFFGESEFALRLPNVLGGFMFFVCGAILVNNFKAKNWFAPLAFIALAGNPFLLDFFSLCRGYGISMGLLAAALLFQQYVFVRKKKSVFAGISLLFSALAVTANYTMFNFFLIHFVFSAVYVIRSLWLDRENRKATYFGIANMMIILISGLAFIRSFLSLMLKLNSLGNFNFGGTSGFWQDTAWSLVMQSCFPIIVERNWLLIVVPIMAGLLFSFIFISNLKFLRKMSFASPEMFISFLIISILGCVAAMIAQHYIFGVFYSADRTALYFLPLFAVLVLATFALQSKWINWFRVLAAFYFVPFVISELAFINTDRVIFWSHDRYMKEFTTSVLREVKEMKSSEVPMIVALPFRIYPSFNYYLYRSGNTDVQLARFDEITWWHLADLGITLEDDSTVPVDPAFVRINELEGKRLFRRSYPIRMSRQRNIGTVNFENNKSDARLSGPGFNSNNSDRVCKEQIFARDIKYPINDTVPPNTFYLMKCSVNPIRLPSRGLAVFAVERDSSLIMWKGWDLCPMFKKINAWQQVAIRMHADIVIQPGDKLQFYISTEGESEFLVDDFTVDEYTLEF